MNKIKNFSRKKQIDSYLKALDKPTDFEHYTLESDFVPNLGNIGYLKKPAYKADRSKRLKYFDELKDEAKKCNLCEKPLGIGSLVIDHEHWSRKIRGVLCQNCNHGLGKFMDDPKLMRKAADYVENFKREEALDYYKPF